MANEATCFSLTTAELATDVQSTAGGKDVDISTQNAAAVAASIDIGLYYLKAAYEGTNGRTKLLQHIEKLKAKVIEAAWPPI